MEECNKGAESSTIQADAQGCKENQHFYFWCLWRWVHEVHVSLTTTIYWLKTFSRHADKLFTCSSAETTLWRRFSMRRKSWIWEKNHQGTKDVSTFPYAVPGPAITDAAEGTFTPQRRLMCGSSTWGKPIQALILLLRGPMGNSWVQHQPDCPRRFTSWTLLLTATDFQSHSKNLTKEKGF